VEACYMHREIHSRRGENPQVVNWKICKHFTPKYTSLLLAALGVESSTQQAIENTYSAEKHAIRRNIAEQASGRGSYRCGCTKT
jgi:hypothetical protein